MSDGAPDAGPIAALRRILATLLDLARTRIDLIAVEVEEQIEHAAKILLWGIAAVFFGSLALLLLAFTIVIAFWDTHRMLAAAGVTAAFALAAAAAGLSVRRRLRQRPRVLSATSAELKRDADALDAERR
ncbi:MAG TPA: phage holin family protein [Steroidobacteraceae bacterium]|nr:phage holin family protein [Steroidobacteraceae bacterium]